jgi:hypothetical protein
MVKLDCGPSARVTFEIVGACMRARGLNFTLCTTPATCRVVRSNPRRTDRGFGQRIPGQLRVPAKWANRLSVAIIMSCNVFVRDHAGMERRAREKAMANAKDARSHELANLRVSERYGIK